MKTSNKSGLFVLLVVVVLSLLGCYADKTDPCQALPFFEGEVKKRGDCGWCVINEENWFPHFSDEGLPQEYQIEGLRLRVHMEKLYDNLYQCNADTSGVTIDYPQVFIFTPCKYEKL